MSEWSTWRKRPVVIEAWHFDGSWASAAPVIDRIGKRATWRLHRGEQLLVISTLEGELIVSPGDWIIKGVKGEFYPCKPDAFSETYEEAT